MAEHETPAQTIGEWELRQARNLGHLDAENDRRDGDPASADEAARRPWRAMTRAHHERGDLTQAEWSAYDEGYETELRLQRERTAPVPATPPHGGTEDEGGFVWGARGEEG